MKIKLKAVLQYEWEEDSENWKDENPQSEQELLQVVRDYVEGDWAYLTDMDAKSLTIEKV